jgi:hypothetical protein
LELDVYNLYTGQLIQNITSPHPDTSFSPLATIVDQGKVVVITQGGHVKAWDVHTGRLAWDYAMDYPWSATGWGVYGVASAYGMFFRPAYDGLYAINWTNGELVWKTSRYTRAAFESPYTDVIGGAEVNPGMTNVRIADEKVYIYDGEHSVDQPKDRAWSLYCFDVYTGEKLWDIAITGSTAFGQDPSTGPIVDGYLIFPATNGIMYTFGRGKSSTTVTAPDVAIPLGTEVLIKGTVMDMSPAQPNTPCVSNDSMRTQMEYLHLQFPIAGIWGNETITGVPVQLTAIAEDGKATDLGTAISNGYTGAFNLAWTPPAKGKYEIIASFGPDESYGSSSSSTALLVGPAPPTPSNSGDQPAIAPPDYTMTIIGASIAVIIVVAIATILILRKR